jgi:hypothetical protein
LVIIADVVAAGSVAADIGNVCITSMKQATSVGVDVAGFVAVSGILYLAMLVDEEVRSDVVVSALVAPKPLVALHVAVGGCDANCMEVVLDIDVCVIGVGGTGLMVMLQAYDAGVDMASCVAVITACVNFTEGRDDADVDVFDVLYGVSDVVGVPTGTDMAAEEIASEDTLDGSAEKV